VYASWPPRVDSNSRIANFGHDAYTTKRWAQKENKMIGLIAFVVCLSLEVVLKEHGASAWLWAPVGFLLGTFVAIQIASPLLIDLPRAIWLIAKGRMSIAVCGPILLKPILRIVALFVVGFFLAPALDQIDNGAVNLGANLGTFMILFSLFWAKSRHNYVASFNTTYGTFFKSAGLAEYLTSAAVKKEPNQRATDRRSVTGASANACARVTPAKGKPLA
jgi:hypothetical protein